MTAAQPIIIKRIKKQVRGHHGGAWKVAFADFVTAMMAFFLLMWLMGSTTQAERSAISDYFQNPSAVQGPGGASTSMIKLGAVDDKQNKEGAVDAKNPNEQDKTKENDQKAVEVVEQEVLKDQERLDSLKEDMEKAIEASQALQPFKDQLLLDITAEGLRIQIIDKENRAMFDSGSSHLKSYTTEILMEFAKLINKVPNKISLTGHTDATPYSSTQGYTNWELSSDRANASRRALIQGGLSASKVAKIVGLSSTILFDKSNPTSPVNRRISMIVLNKQAEQALLNEANAQVKTHTDLISTMMPITSTMESAAQTTSVIIKDIRPNNPSIPHKPAKILLSSSPKNKLMLKSGASPSSPNAAIPTAPISNINPIQLPVRSK